MREIRKLLVFEAQGTDPYRNLAMEELLLSRVRKGELFLYLWQNSHTIVIGRNQDAWSECRVSDFLAAGGRIARRLSGGGAVYHDAGNLNFSFIAQPEAFDIPRQQQILLEALKSFGLAAEISGRNDLTAAGRKFSGNAYYDSGTAKLHHGTLLIAGSTEGMRFLTPEAEKLARHSVSSVQSRVIFLNTLLPGLTPERVRTALKESAEAVCGCRAEAGKLPEPDSEALEALQIRMASPAWVFGEDRGYTHTMHLKTEQGPVCVKAVLKNGRIADAVVYTDALDVDFSRKVRERIIGREPGEAAALPGDGPGFL